MIRFPFSRTITHWLQQRTYGKLLTVNGGEWQFSPKRLALLMRELSVYRMFYLPIPVRGKVVLDVGAGEGETALFYLANGAKHVVCVEANMESCKILRLNSVGKPVTVVCGPFKTEMLKEFKHDFLKMDIEGYEECLLEADLPAPAMVEVHGLQLRDKFMEKGYTFNRKHGDQEKYKIGSISYGYWSC